MNKSFTLLAAVLSLHAKWKGRNWGKNYLKQTIGIEKTHTFLLSHPFFFKKKQKDKVKQQEKIAPRIRTQSFFLFRTHLLYFCLLFFQKKNKKVCLSSSFLLFHKSPALEITDKFSVYVGCVLFYCNALLFKPNVRTRPTLNTRLMRQSIAGNCRPKYIFSLFS